jgi:hypothetical protein
MAVSRFSQSREKEKYGRGSRKQESVCWRGPAEIYSTQPDGLIPGRSTASRTALRFANPQGRSGRSVKLEAPVDLPPEKEAAVSIGYEAGWAPEPVWTMWRTDKSLALGVNWTPIARSSRPQPIQKRCQNKAGMERQGSKDKEEERNGKVKGNIKMEEHAYCLLRWLRAVR